MSLGKVAAHFWTFLLGVMVGAVLGIRFDQTISQALSSVPSPPSTPHWLSVTIQLSLMAVFLVFALAVLFRSQPSSRSNK